MAKTKSKAQRPKTPTAADIEIETIYGIVESGKNPKAIKHALRAAFGSLEVPAASFRRANDDEEFPDNVDSYWQDVFDSLVRELVNVDAWKQAAVMDVDSYRRGLSEHLNAIKRVMNAWCGIKPNRPREDRDRDDLIVRIRISHPKWTFGQVAREYTQKMGSDMTANFAERIYKRSCERDVDELIRTLRPELHFGPFLKSINFVSVE